MNSLVGPMVTALPSQAMPRPYLLPLVPLYYLAVSLRNALYDLGLIKAEPSPVPTVCVGNLEAGGTGKTPHVELLIELLSPKWKVAILSRGYGRSTKGFRWVNVNDDASACGDEPLLIKRHWPSIPVAVCEDRVVGCRRMAKEIDGLELIILDDAYQHRALRCDVNLLVTRAAQPFWQQTMLPAGNLREPMNGAARADAVIVSGSTGPIIPEGIRKKLNGPVLHSHMVQGNPIDTLGQPWACTEAVVLCGIANPERFIEAAEAKVKVRAVHTFNDHHAYTDTEMDRLVAEMDSFGPACGLLTTAKDLARIRRSWPYPTRVAHLPIRAELTPEDRITIIELIEKKCLSR
jgi:tetraacyldisaccharide 4'-kinase